MQEQFSLLDRQQILQGALGLALAGAICVLASFGPVVGADPFGLRAFGAVCIAAALLVGGLLFVLRQADTLR